LKGTIAEKVLKLHLIEGTLDPGSEIAIKIDQTLTQDATGTMAYLEYEALGAGKVKTALSVSYVDHNMLQDGFENADDHLYLQSVAGKFGIYFSRAGNGICHQVHLERFGRPGATLLGSDSHTPTGGALGMIAIGAGGLDVAAAMGGFPFYFICPKVVNIRLEGKLQPWVTAKDVILEILRRLTTKGNVDTIIEYGGSGLKNLSVPERATITNMGAELGVTTSIFPSDEVTKRFLAAQGRETHWQSIIADPKASYENIITINLAEIEPLAACPHSPDNVKPVRELEGIAVNQVLIGSCTNSSYKDLMTVAEIVKGRSVANTVSFGVAPGSRQVLEMVARNGALADLIHAGARILESTCGFCIGAGQSPSSNAVSVRTNNRNFYNRSGTASAQVYLTSPETAAIAALQGNFKDPRKVGIPYPGISFPERFHIDDSMIIPPASNPDSVKIIRGSNIGQPPQNSALPDRLEGIVTIKVGDKVTTDHIMPAGNKLKYRSNIPVYAKYVFEPLDKEFPERCLQNQQKNLHNVIVGGESYGQGSSREHAAICPMYLGVKAVIAKSFERIHAANLVNFGIIPFTFATPSQYDVIQKGDTVVLPDLRQIIANETISHNIVFHGKVNKEITVNLNLSARERQIVLAGGFLNYIRETMNKQ